MSLYKTGLTAVKSILCDSSHTGEPFAQSVCFILGEQDNGVFKLKGAGSMHSALTALRVEAQAAEAEINNRIDGYSIPRERIVQKTRNALAACKFVQISGLPGAGKPVILKTFVCEELEKGTKLFLKSDHLSGATWAQYATITGLGNVDLKSLLVEMMAAGSPTVFIDGIDRVKTEYRGIVKDVPKTMLDSQLLTGLRILVTVRDTRMAHVRTWLPEDLFINGTKTVREFYANGLFGPHRY